MRMGMSDYTESTSSVNLVRSPNEMGPTDSLPFDHSSSSKLIHKEADRSKFTLHLRNENEGDSLLKQLNESVDISSSEDGSPIKVNVSSVTDEQTFNHVDESFANSEGDSDNEEGAKLNMKQVDSGLIISPIRLTEDLPINVEDEENKFSSVTSNMQQKLFYIPTTRQLVAENSSNSDTQNNHTSKSDIETEGSENLSSSTETILNESDKTKLSIQVNETSSLGGESDSLLHLSLGKLKDYDQISLNNSESDMHRNTTSDSLLRTFNDTTSLSSLSTCTDFSISAASIDEGCDGTGLCIDTGDGEFMEISLHSRNSFERKKNPSQDSGFEDRGIKPKRKGLSDFLTR